MTTIILGLGKTGLSCVRYFQRSMPDLSLCLVDSRENPPHAEAFREQYPHIPLRCGALMPDFFKGAERVIVSPGMQSWAMQIQAWVGPRVTVCGDIDIFVEAIAGQGVTTIGITGSNGKSTVTTLVGSCLTALGFRVMTGGNLGTPALDLLSNSGEPWPEVAVLELSSFQLALTQQLPLTAATLLNISPDHLDYHGTLAHYRAAKQRIFRQAQNAVINRDALECYTGLTLEIPVLRFGLFAPENAEEFGMVMTEGEVWLCRGTQRIMRASELSLSGTHNFANVLAAFALTASYAATRGHSIDWEPIRQAIKDFKGLPHRCQRVREVNGVCYINDSKGTNVGATEQALVGLGDSITGKWVLLAGGDGKGADFTTLLPALQHYVKAVVLIGKDKQILADAFKNTVPCHLYNTLEEAVVKCQQLSHAGDGVLLSPACASIDMFTDYTARGDLFTACVQKL